MTRPERRPASTMPENVMCRAAMRPHQEAPPLQHRRGMTMLRPRQVDRIGAARLLCDSLHEGPHVWPEAFQEVRATDRDADETPSSSDDRLEEGEILVD
jgi:hypothetical protein